MSLSLIELEEKLKDLKEKNIIKQQQKDFAEQQENESLGMLTESEQEFIQQKRRKEK